MGEQHGNNIPGCSRTFDLTILLKKMNRRACRRGTRLEFRPDLTILLIKKPYSKLNTICQQNKLVSFMLNNSLPTSL